jgi:hypothetical protein
MLIPCGFFSAWSCGRNEIKRKPDFQYSIRYAVFISFIRKRRDTVVGVATGYKLDD